MNAIIPMSIGQQGLWYLAKTGHEACASYNVVLAFTASGTIDRANLQRAFDSVVAQHPILGARVVVRDYVPQFDCSGQQRAQVRQLHGKLSDCVLAEAEAPFELDVGPLYRVSIVQESAGAVGLVITVHHVAFDGESVGILMNALEQSYVDLNSQPEIDNSKANRGYADRERSFLTGDTGRTLLLERATYLKDLAFNFSLPIAKAKRATTGPAGTVEAKIEQDISHRVKALASDLGATPSAIYLSAFFILLWQYTRADDLAVAMPTDAREADDQAAIGYMVNTTIVRATVSSTDTLTRIIERITDLQFDALATSRLPFPSLVRAIKGLGGNASEGWLNLMFSYLPVGQREWKFGETSLVAVASSSRFAKNLLRLEIEDLGKQVSGVLNYDASAIDEKAARRLLEHYVTLIEYLVEDPSLSLREVPLMSPSERHRTLVQWNETNADFPHDKCIHQLVSEQAARTPNALAVIFENQRLTYAQLDTRTDQLAKQLIEKGVKLGDLVALCVERGLQMVLGVLGILKAGAAYLPLDPSLPPDRLRFMLEDSGARVVLMAGSTIADWVVPGQVRVVGFPEPLQGGLGNIRLPKVPTCSPAYLIYTSGSTGKPKGVIVPHVALANFLHSMRRMPGLVATDLLAAVTTLSFDIAALEIYLPLLVGATVEIISREISADGTALMNKLHTSQATVMQATPSTWRLLLEAGWTGGAGFRVLCGGEAFPQELAHALHKDGCIGEIWNLYGPTETTVWSTAARVIPGGSQIVIGRPIDNTQVYVVDEAGQPLPVGLPGELWIGGIGIASGYLGRPDTTAERFIPDPFSSRCGVRLYRTGDLARWTQDGDLEHLGRIDQQVKVRGHRIELGEVEAALQRCEGVREAVVLMVQTDMRLVAYLVPTPDAELTAAELRKELSRFLPDYMLPTNWICLDALPRNPNGKLDRSALSLTVVSQSSVRLLAQTVSPETQTERWVADIWRQVLNVETVGRQDNFFVLGGHSLLATQIVARAAKHIGRTVPLRLLLDSPTLSAFADQLDRLPTSAEGSRTTPPLTRRARNSVKA